MCTVVPANNGVYKKNPLLRVFHCFKEPTIEHSDNCQTSHATLLCSCTETEFQHLMLPCSVPVLKQTSNISCYPALLLFCNRLPTLPCNPAVTVLKQNSNPSSYPALSLASKTNSIQNTWWWYQTKNTSWPFACHVCVFMSALCFRFTTHHWVWNGMQCFCRFQNGVNRYFLNTVTLDVLLVGNVCFLDGPQGVQQTCPGTVHKETFLRPVHDKLAATMSELRKL